MKFIELTAGKFALVDDEDFEMVNALNWNANFQHTTWYARAWQKPKRILMHRLIMGVTDSGILVDHRNHDGLDNRRNNLRIASKADNCRNKSHRNGTSSKYHGVCWHKATNKWITKICVDYTDIHLGIFEKEEDAALAYNVAAVKYFDKFANLNIIPDTRELLAKNSIEV